MTQMEFIKQEIGVDQQEVQDLLAQTEVEVGNGAHISAPITENFFYITDGDGVRAKFYYSSGLPIANALQALFGPHAE